MPTDIIFPETGESITTGVIASWSRGEGEWIDRDETIAEIETDKITVELPAPASGVVSKHLFAEGDEIEVGAVIGSIDESAKKPAGKDGSPKAGKMPAPPDAGGTPATPGGSDEATKRRSDGGAGAGKMPAPPESSAPTPKAGVDVRATPLARKVAREHGVNLADVAGTGAGERVREEDVLNAIKAGGAKGAPKQASAPARAPAPPVGSRESRRERLSPLRQRVAARLVQAQHAAAMLTTFNECDMSGVIALRARYKESFEKEHGVGLGFMSFFVKSAVAALRAHPRVNASIIDDSGSLSMEQHDYCDIAIAVASPKGLVVPVLRNAEAMSFAQIETAIKDMAMRAQAGQLTLDEIQGGTFTITNGGVFGSLNSTPILNPPQSAILGMHAIKKRPVEDPASPGQIALRPMMHLALSYDHRLIDGAEAVRFLVHIKEGIEDPGRMLLDG